MGWFVYYFLTSGWFATAHLLEANVPEASYLDRPVQTS